MEYRDKDTDHKALQTLQGAVGISEHGATVAIRTLISSNFIIKEIRPDPDEPEFEPYGSAKGMLQRAVNIEDRQIELDREKRLLIDEFHQAVRSIQPVFKAIQIAMEVKDGPSDSLSGDDAGSTGSSYELPSM